MTTTTPTEGTTATFADLGVEQTLCDALADAGIIHPFPIQELTLPLALSGADVIGQARTGTGKTLAFGLPLLQRITREDARPKALVVVPTRELCVQVTDDLTKAGAHKGVEVVAVYGGRAIEPQIAAVRRGVPVVVGTPGRLLDLMERGVLDLSEVTTLVLDEADEMLDLGFLPDVERLIEATSTERQTLLFSATMPPAVVALARRYMSKPTFLRADVEENRIAPATRQFFFSCHRLDKPAVLARILQAPERGLCVVFTRTKRMADILADELNERGVKAAPIHSDLRQEARERALQRFRDGRIDVLVATEVAARGLDIDDVTHVVNYDCPDDEKMYLHRIGRTGRAGAAGVAVTLAVWNELARMEMIKRALEVDEPTHEVFSTSDILDELFDLPAREARTAGKSSGEDGAARDKQGRGKATQAAGRGGEEGRGGRRGGKDERAGAQRRGRSGGKSARGDDERKPARADTERTPARADDERKSARADDGDGTAGRAAERREQRGRSERPESRRDTTRRPPGERDDTSTDETEDGGRRRVRRRGGASDRTTSGRTAAETRTDASAPTPAAKDADEGGASSRRRVRRRVGGDASAEERPSPRTGADGDDTQRAGRRAQSQGRGGARGGARSDRVGNGARSDRDGNGARGGGGRGGRGGTGGSERRGNGARADDAGRGGRDGGRRGGGRDRASGRSAGARDEPRAARSQPVDTQTARGDGKPRLRRPLEVAHLP